MTYISSGTIYVKPSTAIGIEKTKQECGINPESIDTHYNDKFGEINIDDESESMDNITNFCQLIAEIDKQNHGEIKCYGESEEDLWRIIVKNGRAIVQRGYIKYYGNGRFLNPDVRKITKNFKGKKLSAWLL